MQKPSITSIFSKGEILKGALSSDFGLPSLSSYLGNFEHAMNLTRMILVDILMENKYPSREPDGTVNWDNFFQSAMQTTEPIKRKDVFPNGTDGMSDDEIWKVLLEYVGDRSLKFNFGPNSTAYDPVEFPEVIGAGIREQGVTLNGLPFLRTVDSWQARPDNGYGCTGFGLSIDMANAQAKGFVKKFRRILRKYTKENVEARFDERFLRDGFLNGRLWLHIIEPKDWKTIELGNDVQTPDEFMESIAPGFFDSRGYITNRELERKVQEDGRFEKYLEYKANYNRRTNRYANSDECKQIHDEFWAEVTELTKTF